MIITKIEIINGQSHKHSVIHLSEGLNIIVANNSTGKTVLFKFLEDIANPTGRYDKKERRNLIRWGHDFSELRFHFSDNTIGIVRFYLDRTEQFLLSKNESGKVDIVKLEEVPNILTTRIGLLLSNNGTILNKLTNKSPNFLVDSDTKVNEDIIRLLSEDRRVVKAIEYMEEELKELKVLYKEAQKEMYYYESKLSEIEFIDLTNYKQMKENLEKTLSLGEFFVPIIESVDRLQPTVNTKHNDLENYMHLCDLHTVLSELEMALESKPREIGDIQDILTYLDILEHLNFIDGNLKEIRTITLDEQLITYLDIYESLKILVTLTEDVDQNIAKLDLVEERFESLTNYLKENSRVVSCEIYGKVGFINGECVPLSN